MVEFDENVIFIVIIFIIVISQLLLLISLIFQLYCKCKSSEIFIFQEIIAIICFIACIIAAFIDIFNTYYCSTHNWVMFTIHYPMDILFAISEISTFIGCGSVVIIWYLNIFIKFKDTVYQISTCFHLIFWLLVVFSMAISITHAVFFIINSNDNISTNESYVLPTYQRYNFIIMVSVDLILLLSLTYLFISKARIIYEDGKAIFHRNKSIISKKGKVRGIAINHSTFDDITFETNTTQNSELLNDSRTV